MSKSFKFAGAAALSAFMAFSSAASARVPEIPQSLIDRYGERDRTNSGISRSNKGCSKTQDLMKGRVLQREFENGHRRSTLSLSHRDGGTIKFELELSTSGQGLPAQSCSIF